MTINHSGLLFRATL